MTQSKTGGGDTLLTCLERSRPDLHQLEPRLEFVCEIHDQLAAVSKGKTFTIYNDLVWQAAFDARDMCLIRLSDWADAELAPTGLFAAVKRAVPRFSRRRSWIDPHEGDDVGLTTELDRAHREAFDRLFPNCVGHEPTNADVDALRGAFQTRLASLRHDRNKNRVHMFENRRTSGNVRMLSPAQVQQDQNYCQGLLDDLQHVALGHTSGWHALSSMPPGDAAKDMVDLILLGGLSRYRMTVKNQMRDDFWAAAHERHDARGLASDKPPFFNDWEFTNPGE
ncbi:MAG TPA: hypothetical protein PKD61_06410 [Polyangiaceae bacterium]|nr:hypothetical protein [Polyangiaceae bacterium]